MDVIRGFHNLRERHRGCVLAIGNFDGVHLGHQALLSRLRALADELNQPMAVQVFEPTPREFFSGKGAVGNGEQPPGRIDTFRDKLAGLERCGVERVLCARFDQRLARMPAQDYVRQVLVEKLGVRAVMVGDDFRFGAGRGGDLALLQALGQVHGFTAEAMSTVEIRGIRASSSAIREALAMPDLALAVGMLGRIYSLSGRVRAGLRLGRKLGMPTANIALHRHPALRFGVYAVEASAGRRQWQGVANIGVRPTLENSRCLLEAHLFGDVGDLYGAVLRVDFRRFLRPELRFDSLDALREQMHRDASQAQEWFRQA